MTQTPASAPLVLATVPRISLPLTDGCCAGAGCGAAPVSARTIVKSEGARNRSDASAGLIGNPSQAAIRTIRSYIRQACGCRCQQQLQPTYLCVSHKLQHITPEP